MTFIFNLQLFANDLTEKLWHSLDLLRIEAGCSIPCIIFILTILACLAFLFVGMNLQYHLYCFEKSLFVYAFVNFVVDNVHSTCSGPGIWTFRASKFQLHAKSGFANTLRFDLLLFRDSNSFNIVTTMLFQLFE